MGDRRFGKYQYSAMFQRGYLVVLGRAGTRWSHLVAAAAVPGLRYPRFEFRIDSGTTFQKLRPMCIGQWISTIRLVWLRFSETPEISLFRGRRLDYGRPAQTKEQSFSF